MPGKVPVEKVGGTQDTGPWPSHVDEIVEGEQYDRPVHFDGEDRTVTVTVTEDRETSDGARIVSYQFDGGNA